MSSRFPLALLVCLLSVTTACASAAPAERRTPRTPYEVVLERAEGGVFDFASLKGRVVLVSFFATWCFPCLLEVPEFQKLERAYRSSGFSVVAIGMDLEGRKVLQPFVESYRPGYTVLVASQELRSGRTPFGEIREIPTTLLLDRQGKVAAAVSGPIQPAALESVVSQLLK